MSQLQVSYRFHARTFAVHLHFLARLSTVRLHRQLQLNCRIKKVVNRVISRRNSIDQNNLPLLPVEAIVTLEGVCICRDRGCPPQFSKSKSKMSETNKLVDIIDHLEKTQITPHLSS